MSVSSIGRNYKRLYPNPISKTAGTYGTITADSSGTSSNVIYNLIAIMAEKLENEV